MSGFFVSSTRRGPHTSLSFARAFSSTPRAATKPRKVSIQHQIIPKELRKLVPEHLHRSVPEYPFGPSQWFKQMNTGLYGGAQIQFGNMVSEEWDVKNRRYWKPNIHSKKLWSASLEKWVRVKLSARVLRTIDKVGGLDEYLLGEKTGRLKELGPRGWMSRWIVMQTPTVKERFRKEREQLGLPPEPGIDEGTVVSEAFVNEVVDGEESLNDHEKAWADTHSRDITDTGGTSATREEATARPQPQPTV